MVGMVERLRLKLASLAIKHPESAQPWLERLLGHAADADDRFLPLMYWYALMDLPPERVAALFAGCRVPLVRQNIARRCTGGVDQRESNFRAG